MTGDAVAGRRARAKAGGALGGSVGGGGRLFVFESVKL